MLRRKPSNNRSLSARKARARSSFLGRNACFETLENRSLLATLTNFLTTEHVDLNVGYNGGWSVSPRLDGTTSYSPDDALLYVGKQALEPRPAGSQYDFIGLPAGDDYYRLPASQNPSLLYLGTAAYDVSGLDSYNTSVESKGRLNFNSAWVKLGLAEVKHFDAAGNPGTGVFSLWEDGATPKVFMSSYNDGIANPNANGLDTTDGISADDALWVIAGSHNHFNFGFSKPGRYEVDLNVSAYFGSDGNPSTPNLGGLQSTSVPIRLYFSVVNVGQLEFDASSYTVNEGAGTASINVRRVNGSDGQITVNYGTTAGGSATLGDDYTAVSGTLTFEDQETVKTITIPILEDDIVEPAEMINLSLSAPGPASIANYVSDPFNDNSSLIGPQGTATLSIIDNDTNAPPVIAGIANQTTLEDTAKDVTISVSDDRTPVANVVLSAVSSNQTLLPDANLVFSGSGASRTLTFSPAENQTGTAAITVTAVDGDGVSSTQTFEVTVGPVNDLPTISFIPDVVMNEDGEFIVNFTIGDAETPVSSLTLTKSRTQSNSQLFNLSSRWAFVTGMTGAERAIRLAPTADQSGTAVVTVTVSDGTSTFSRTFNVTVNPVQDPPRLLDDNLLAIPGTTSTLDVLKNDKGLEAGQTLSLQSIIQPAHGTLSIATDGKSLQYTPNAGYVGPDEFTYTVVDNGGLQSTATGYVTVGNYSLVDSPTSPQHTDLYYNYVNGEWILNLKTDARFGPTGTLGGPNNPTYLDADEGLLFVDPSTKTTRQANNQLTNYDFLGVPEGADIWRLRSNSVGNQLYLGVASEDTPAGTFAEFTSTNPQVADFPTAEWMVLELVTFSGPGHFSAYFDPNAVAFDTADGINGPNEAGAGGNPDDSFWGFPNTHTHLDWFFTAAGRYELGFRAVGWVSDGAGGLTRVESPVTTFYVDVDSESAPGERLGEAAPTAADDTATAVAGGSPVSIAVLDNDSSSPDTNEALRVLSATGGNGTLAVSGDARSIVYTPHATFVGTDTFTYTLVDEHGGTSTATVSVDVAQANQAPVIGPIANVAILQGTQATVNFTAGDSETAAGDLQFSFASSNPGLIPTANIAVSGAGVDRTLLITPVAGQAGSATIIVTVTDAEGLHTSESFVLTVAANVTVPFALPEYYGGEVSSSAFTAMPADFNGDGNVDLLLVGGGTNSLRYSQGTGDGGFLPEQGINVGLDLNAQGAAVVDYDGDGDIDVIAYEFNAATNAGTANEGTISLYRNDGTGQFTRTVLKAGLTQGYNLAVGDFNGDDRPDVVYSYYRFTTGVGYTQGTDYALQLPTGELASSTALSNYYGTMRVVDANSDGNLDIVTGRGVSDPAFSIFLGNADGTFDAPQNLLGGTGTSIIDVVDINGDGLLDLVVGERVGSSRAGYYPQQADGSFGPRVSLLPHVTQLNGLRVADINQDGIPDLLNYGITGGAFNTYWTPGLGGGFFGSPIYLFNSQVANPGSGGLHVLDLDNDSYPDIVAVGTTSTTAPGTVAVFINKTGENPMVLLPPVARTRVAGDPIDLQVYFGFPIAVTGAPRIALQVGGNTVYADYVSGSGTPTLTFRYTVTASDLDLDGVQLASNLIDLNGGTLTDPIGGAAVLQFPNEMFSGVIVNGRGPLVQMISRLDSAATDAGTVRFAVQFTEDVTGVDVTDFNAFMNDGDLAGANVVSVSGAGSQYEVTVSTGTGSGTLGLSVKDSASIFDSSGDILGKGYTGGQVYTVRPAAVRNIDTYYTSGHADYRPVWNNGEFSYILRADPGVLPNSQYASDEVITYADSNAIITRPSATTYDFLGVAAGDPLHVLPSSNTPSLPYLGFSGESTPAGAFASYRPSDPRITSATLRDYLKVQMVGMRSSSGGDFSMYSISSGNPVVWMASSDGISDNDSLWLYRTHFHRNLAFSKPGTYEIDVVVSGYLDSNGNGTYDPVVDTYVESGIQTMVFHVDTLGARGDSFVVGSQSAITGSVTANDAWSDGFGDFTATVETGPTKGALTLQPDGSFTYQPSAAYDGTDSFVYRLTNERGGYTLATVSLVADVPPTISPIANQATDEDTVASINFTAEDSETAAGQLQFSFDSSNPDLIPVSNIAISGPGAARTLTITPIANQFGSATITVTVIDSAGQETTETFVLTVNPVDDAPVANDDAYTVDEDGTLTVGGTGVLANDSDPDGDALNATVVNGPQNGIVTLNPDGSFTYVPNPNFSGTDTFTYTTTDVRYQIRALGTLGGNNSFALDVNNNRQVSGNSSITAGSNNPLQAYVWENGAFVPLGVLPGTGTNNFSRSYAINDSGVVVGESDNNTSFAFVYQNGVMTGLTRLAGDNFRGVANDINNGGVIAGASSDGVATRPTIWVFDGTTYIPADLGTIRATPTSTGRAWAINDAGMVVGLSHNEDGTSQATLWSGGTITNLTSLGDGTRFSQAYGLNEDGLVVGSSSTGQTVGQLTGTTSSTGITRAFVWHDGHMHELLPANFYAAGNTGAMTNYHSVAMDVNDVGIIVGNSQRISGSPARATLWLDDSVLDLNSLIPAGSGWTLLSAEGINANGDIIGYGSFGGFTRAFLLTPANVDGDGNLFGNTATVTITVNPQADAPTATNDQYVVGQGSSAHGNVLVNASDPDGDSISAAITTQPTSGSVTFNANGAFVYTPSAAFTGSDSFTYAVTDSTGRSSTATVTVSAATPKSFEVVLGSGHVDIGLFIGSGEEVIDHGGHSHTVTGEPEWDLHVHDHEAEQEYHADKALLYVGPQALTTRGSEIAGPAYDFLGVAPGEQFYMLPASQNPELLYLSLATEEIEAGTLEGGSARLYLRAVNGPGHFSMFGFTSGEPNVMFSTSDGITEADFVELLEGGHAHYNFVFSTAGRYEVTFEAVGAVVGHDEVVSATTTYYFSVDSLGRVQFSSANYEVAEDGTQTITVERIEGSDGPLTVDYASLLGGSATSGVDYMPTSGNLTFGDGEMSKTFTITTLPDTLFEGNETFPLELTLPAGSFAELGSQSQAEVTITDDDSNSLPTIGQLADLSTSEDTPITGVAITVGDVETQASELTVSAVSSNTSLFPAGSITLSGSGTNRTLSLTPAANASGTATITVTVTDEHGGVSTETFEVNVTAVNDLPTTSTIAAQTTAEDTPIVNLPVTIGDVETAAGSLAVTATSSNTGLFPAGSIVVSGSGPNRQLTLTPAPNASGVASITVTVTDADGGVRSEVFTVNVTAVNDLPTITPIDGQSTNEDAPLTGVAFGVGDMETPAGSLTVSAVSSNTQLFPPGSISIAGSGSDRTLTLAPAANQSGSATITLAVTDANGGTSTQTFTIVVAAVNDAPVATGGAIVASPGQPTTGVLTATDIDGPTLTYSILVPPTKGTVTITNPATGAYTYTPSAVATGTDSFQFQASDGTSVSNPATVNVTLQVGGTPNTVVKVGNDLVITGTSGNDQAFVTNLFGQLRVYLNGRLHGPFDISGRIVVTTGDGSDFVIISPWNGSSYVDVGTGNDVVLTGDGDGTIIGGAGNDAIYAGRGNNLVWGDNENAPHNSPGAGRDTITTVGGNSTIYSGGGNDLILAGSGNDVIHAGDGDDTVLGGLGNDVIRGGQGNDSLDGGPGNNIVIQDENAAPTISKVASQTMTAGNSLANLSFTIGDLETAASALSVSAASSNTALFPQSSIVVNGSGTNRTITLTPTAGQSGTATISLEVRDEAGAVTTESFVVTVAPVVSEPPVVPPPVTSQPNTVAMVGNDLRIVGTPNVDAVAVTGVAGQLYVVLNGRSYGPFRVNGQLWIEMGDAADAIVVQGWQGATYVNAGAGNDNILTGDGNDTIIGGAGNDTIRSGGGDDYIDAGDGNDFVYGEAGNDIVRGGAGNDFISGGLGDDIVLGNEGVDQLTGDAGRDLVIAGKGRDTTSDTDFDSDILVDGWTTYDAISSPTSMTDPRTANDAALQAILSEWIRGAGSIAQRSQRILAGGGLNGAATLALGQSAHSDNEQDSLASSVLSVDWLFAEAGLDRVTRQGSDLFNGS